MYASRITLTILAMLFALSVAADGLESTKPNMIGERPDPSGTPTEISLGVHVFDIDEIDDAKQRFNIDLVLVLNWQDARLALPEGQRSDKVRSLALDDIWSPRGLIVNDRGLIPQLPRFVDVDDLGNVSYLQRLSGELAADLKYEKFPFDTQRLPIDVISYKYTPGELRFSRDTSITGDAAAFSEEGWAFRIIEPEFDEYRIPSINVDRPRLTFIIEAERNTGYYVWTMFLPMTLIVFMSWTAFWLQPGLVPPRVGISTATVFSLIAFGFSIRVSLPPVPYLTRADVFVVGCTMLVFLSLAVTVIGSRWASAEQMDRALQLNALSRWLYAVLYGVVITVALFK